MRQFAFGPRGVASDGARSRRSRLDRVTSADGIVPCVVQVGPTGAIAVDCRMIAGSAIRESSRQVEFHVMLRTLTATADSCWSAYCWLGGYYRMTSFWESVSAGVVANVATIVLTVGVGGFLVVLRWRALMRFWGIRDSRKVRIYLSHLRITSGGALDASGNPRSYQGSVVTLLESEMGAVLKGLFVATVPGGALQPNWLKALLLVNADVQVCASPDSAEQIEPDGAVVSLGSPGYNVVSAAIELNCKSPVRFGPNNTSIQLPGNLSVTNPRQCVVVRLWSGGRVWFYAAGLAG